MAQLQILRFPRAGFDVVAALQRRLNKHKTIIAAFGIAIWVVSVLSYSILRPQYNWDVVGYVARAHIILGVDSADLHAATYRTIRAATTDEQFRRIVGPQSATPPGFGETAFADPHAFSELHPWYAIRPAYNYLLAATAFLGANTAKATVWISAIAASAGLAICMLIALRFAGLYAALVLLPIAGILVGLLDVATLSTPDAVSFFAMSVVAYAWIQGYFWVMLMGATTLPLIRTDLVLVSAAITLAATSAYRGRLIFLCAMGCFQFFEVAAINVTTDYPGWAAIFQVSLVKSNLFPLTAPEPLTVSNAARAYLRGIVGLVRDQAFLFVVFLWATIAVIVLRSFNRWSQEQLVMLKPALTLSALSLVTFLAHFALFPASWPRFFLGVYMWSILAILIVFTESFEAHPKLRIEK